MRLYRAMLILSVLAGCSSLESAEVQQCERFITAKLRSPSTYKRIDKQVTHINPNNPSDLNNLTEVWVSIEYDAANAYGTPIRDRYTCKFPRKDGKADTSNYIDFDAPTEVEIDAASDELDAAADAAINEVTPN